MKTPEVPPADWTDVASAYAAPGGISKRIASSYVDDLTQYLHLTNRSKVLDVACGSGAVGLRIASKVLWVDAIDSSDGMIEQQRQALRDRGIDNVFGSTEDAMHLSSLNDRYDAVTCNFALMLFPNIDDGVTEMFRVLKPGGRIGISAWAAADKFDTFGLFFKAVQRVAAKDQVLRSAIEAMGEPHVFALSDREHFGSVLGNAGFHNISVREVAHSIWVSTAEEMWTLLTTNIPPAKEILDAVGPKLTADIHSAYSEVFMDRFEKEFDGGPFELVNTANIAFAMKPDPR